MKQLMKESFLVEHMQRLKKLMLRLLFQEVIFSVPLADAHFLNNDPYPKSNWREKRLVLLFMFDTARKRPLVLSGNQILCQLPQKEKKSYMIYRNCDCSDYI